MKPKAKRRLWILGLLLVLVCGGAYFAVVGVAERLVSPPRRVVQDYHREWLELSTDHGVQIERFVFLGGEAPCLVVSPSPSGVVSERGEIIRRQLVEMGYVLPRFGEVRGILLLLHGRKGRKEDLLPVAERFCAVGFRCVLPDLPSHGESPRESVHYGAGVGEAEFAEQVLAEVIKKGDAADLPTGIWGISMGGAFAAKALSVNHEVWDCAVIVSSFDSLSEVIRDQSDSRAWVLGSAYSAALHSTLRNRHGLDPTEVRPVDWVGEVTVPVMVAHGTVDSLFPMERGRALYEAIPSQNKRWVEVEGGDHDDVLITPMPLYATMATWFLDHLSVDGQRE